MFVDSRKMGLLFYGSWFPAWSFFYNSKTVGSSFRYTWYRLTVSSLQENARKGAME